MFNLFRRRINDVDTQEIERIKREITSIKDEIQRMYSQMASIRGMMNRKLSGGKRFQPKFDEEDEEDDEEEDPILKGLSNEEKKFIKSTIEYQQMQRNKNIGADK